MKFIPGRPFIHFGEIHQRKNRCPEPLPGHPDGRKAHRACPRARRACSGPQRRRRLDRQDKGIRGRSQSQEAPLSQSLIPFLMSP